MPIDAATLTVFLPPAAAIAQTMNSFFFVPGEIASIVTLPPLTFAFVWTTAVLLISATFSETAAPMLVSFSRLIAAPSPNASAFVWLTALILTLPVAVRWTPEPTDAVLFDTTQLSATAAAMPTPPLFESPVLLLDSLLAWSVEPLADGVEPPVLPVAFGLFWTWSSFCESASLP